MSGKSRKKRLSGERKNGQTESKIIIHGLLRDPVFDQLKDESGRGVVVLEGRPQLDAARDSCAKLLKRKITPTLMADNMAGFLFYQGLVKEVWLAYQQADQNGAICDIGSLILGVLAAKHKIPVKCFPAERLRASLAKEKEIFYFGGIRVAPNRIKGYVPLVEWVPGRYITQVHV